MQLDGQIAQVKGNLALEVRRAHRENYEELGRERYELERRIEANMSALLEALAELRRLDNLQRNAGRLAGDEGIQARDRLPDTLRGWLSQRLGGVGGYLDLPVAPGRERPLGELDPLARKGKGV